MTDKLDRAQGRLKSSPPAPGDLVDAEAAGELLNLPKSWVLTAARQNRIPHVRLGRYVRFEPEMLLNWAREHRQGPPIVR